MKLKLDQNMDPRSVAILSQAGHEVATVKEQNLTGAKDEIIAAVCRQESRCLITLDKDFANKFIYPPQSHFGIIVLRHPKPTSKLLLELVRQLCEFLKQRNPVHKLWIVEPGRVRETE